jgi:mediator of DNA damage checkpoint protein 1
MCIQRPSVHIPSSRSLLTYFSQIPTPDLEVLSSGLTSLGGSFRAGLTRDTTHLITLSPSPSDLKYTTAMHFRDATGIKIVLPHWFDDCVRLGFRVSEDEYEWPEPRVLRGLDAYDAECDGDEEKKKKGGKVDREQRMVLKGALWMPGKAVMEAEMVQKRDVWGGKRILLSTCLGLSEGSLGAVVAGIKRAGGVAVVCEVSGGKGKQKEVELMESCDVLITRWRSGAAYAKVCQDCIFLLRFSIFSS